MVSLYSRLTTLWNDWGIEMLVLVSFALQTVLTLCGNCRRCIPGFWIRFTVWSAYFLSGSIAKVIIGKLSGIEIKHTEENVPRELDALLAPLLLVQPGNPDTITAYSIEDNRLVLRQFLRLIFQVGIGLVLQRHVHSPKSTFPKLCCSCQV